MGLPTGFPHWVMVTVVLGAFDGGGALGVVVLDVAAGVLGAAEVLTVGVVVAGVVTSGVVGLVEREVVATGADATLGRRFVTRTVTSADVAATASRARTAIEIHSVRREAGRPDSINLGPPGAWSSGVTFDRQHSGKRALSGMFQGL